MIEEWKQSAKTLIYHFHIVLQGRVPFARTWTEEKQREANLDDEAVAYLKHISLIVSKRRELNPKTRASLLVCLESDNYPR